jgi:hypothetical protein
VPGGLGPVLTLTNLGGQPNAQVAVDLNSYTPVAPAPSGGTYNPAARILALDDYWSDDIVFQSNTQGKANSGLRTDMIIIANGSVGIGNFSQSSLPQAMLDMQGTTRTKVLTITKGAGLAEPFKTSGHDLP